MTFKKTFAEVQYFGDGGYVISAEQYTREQAAAKFSDYFGETIDPDRVEADRVRYQFAAEWSDFDPGEHAWFSGAFGRGSKPVWVFGA